MFGRWTPQLLLLWDLIIVTVVATVAVQYRDYSAWDVVIGIAMAVALIARRHAPVRVFTVIAVLGAVQVVSASAVPAGYDVALLVAMLAVVTHSPGQRAVYLSGLVVAAGSVVASLVRIDAAWSGSVLDYPYLAEQAVILAAGGALWLIAYVLRTNRERGVVLAERAVAAERERDQLARLAAADERTFIARELHDVVAHSLAVMIAQADGARYVLDTDAERAREAMGTVAGTGREALDDMHRIVAVLRGTGGEENPEDRRRRGLGQLGTVVERARAAGLDVESRIDGDVERLSPAEELTVFRIAQESLTNALRHAGPGTRVAVGLAVESGRAVLEVRDDGTGAAPATTGGGNGLIGMRERVAVHGGELSAGPGPDGGWLVRAMIPVKEEP